MTSHQLSSSLQAQDIALLRPHPCKPSIIDTKIPNRRYNIRHDHLRHKTSIAVSKLKPYWETYSIMGRYYPLSSHHLACRLHQNKVTVSLDNNLSAECYRLSPIRCSTPNLLLLLFVRSIYNACSPAPLGYGVVRHPTEWDAPASNTKLEVSIHLRSHWD